MVPKKPQIMTIQEIHEHSFSIYTSFSISNVSPEVAKTQALYNLSLSLSKNVILKINTYSDRLSLNYHKKTHNVLSSISIHTWADTATPSKFLSEQSLDTGHNSNSEWTLNTPT